MLDNTRLGNIEYVVDRLINPSGTAEGSVLPQRQRGYFRVPFVTYAQVVNVHATTGGNQVIMVWEDAKGKNIDSYNIYYILGAGTIAQAVFATSAGKSPAKFSLPASLTGPITFFVQTVMKNGQTSDLESSPTCTATLTPA